MPTALITGVTGQDGSYLAEFLLAKGYTVIGMVRRTSTINFDRIKDIQDKIEIVQGDLLDQMSLINLLHEFKPDEVYNLAAQSFVPTSFTQPVLTGEFTALGVTRMLEAIRIVDPKIRFYQASSSEMFGKVVEVPQREETPFYPRSPYGVAKVYGHWITVNYRESYRSMPVRVSSSTTRVPGAGWNSSPTRSPTSPRASSWASPTSCVWAIWRRGATGALPATTCAPCGSCSRRRVPTTMWSPRAKPTASRSSWKKPSAISIWTGAAMWCRIPSSIALLKWTCWWATPAKAGRKLGWEPEVDFRQLVRLMVDADMRLLQSGQHTPNTPYF